MAFRPEFVEAELYAGDVSTGKKVKLTADNKWTASFGEMDLKKDGNNNRLYSGQQPKLMDMTV